MWLQIGSFKSRALASDPCVRSVDSPSVPSCPPPSAALGDLAGNLRWSWHPETQDVFEEVDPELWESTGPRPGPAARRGRPRAGSTSSPADEGFLERLGRGQRRPASATSPATAGTSAAGRSDGPRRSPTSPRSSASPPCCRSTPAASASSPATTSRRPATSACRSSASACSTGTATSSSRSRARAGSRRPTRSSTPTGCRSRCCARPTAPAPTITIALPGGPELIARIWVASVGRVPLLMLDTDVEGNPDHYATSPTGSTAATASTGCARSCCSASAASARCAPTRRITGAPDARGVPHQRGPRRLPRPRADPRAHRGRGRPAARLRHRARGRPRLHRLHHPHAGARPASTGSRATLVEQYFGGDGADPRRPGRPDPGARHRGLRGRRPVGLQHGGDGLPARPARQRRLPAARPRQPRHVRRPLARLRRGRGADRLDHQRRARADLGRPRGHRAGRSATAPTPTPTTPTASGRRSTRSPATDIWAVKRAAARAARRRRPQAGCAARGRSAAPPRPSSAGSTPRSTPTCSRSASRAGCRRTSG